MPSQRITLATFAAIAGIFVLDLNTPLGIAVPFLYLLVVLVAIAMRASNRQLLLFAAVCTGLAASKLLLPQLPGVVEFGQSNRLLFGLLLWALLGLEFIRRGEALRQANVILQGELAERRRAESTINDYANRLQGLAGRLVEVQEIERKALAEALHDRIGQNLSTLNISLNLALAQLPDEAPSAVKARLRERAEMALFRVVQEALTNVAKHAAASRVTVSLRRIADGIELTIADDGRGMTAELAGRASHSAIGSGWGLALCQERARAIGASLVIASAGQGTSIAVEVPNGKWEK